MGCLQNAVAFLFHPGTLNIKCGTGTEKEGNQLKQGDPAERDRTTSIDNKSEYILALRIAFSSRDRVLYYPG